MEDQTYLTPAQVAALLQFSLAGLYRKLKHGQIPGALKMGGVWRIRRSVLEASFQAPTLSPEARQALVQVLPLNGRSGG